MKKRLLALAGIAALSMSLILPMAAAAENAGQVLYEQNFESGKNEFINTNPENDGTSSIVEENGNKFLQLVTNNGDEANGYLHFWGPMAEDGSLALNMEGDWDYTLRVRPDYIKNPDHNWIKICTAAQDGKWENACYMFEMWQWRGKIAIKENDIGLNDLNNPLVEGMENEGFEFNDGIWYNVKMSRRANKISVYVNDKLCVYMTDEENRFQGGTIAFCSWGANFSVDDLKVVGYTGDGPDPTPTSAATTTSTTVGGETAATTSGATTVNNDFVFPWIPVVIAATAVILIGGGVIVFLAVKKKNS